MRVEWPQAWRIVASRYPPIDLFERVAGGNARVSEALIALEQLTNPRLRDAIGQIALVPPERRVSGPGASYVMAPFTHINCQGSRFADGTFGAYYAAADLGTAIAETVYHFARFAADSDDPPRSEDMRVLVGKVSAELTDVDDEAPALRTRLLDPDDYSASQRWARELREGGADGVVYPSVRRKGGRCLAAFWPDVPAIPKQERHLQYHWNGERVDRYFDYHADRWLELS
jgi:RES domain-containing protein